MSISYISLQRNSNVFFTYVKKKTPSLSFLRRVSGVNVEVLTGGFAGTPSDFHILMVKQETLRCCHSLFIFSNDLHPKLSKTISNMVSGGSVVLNSQCDGFCGIRLDRNLYLRTGDGAFAHERFRLQRVLASAKRRVKSPIYPNKGKLIFFFQKNLL